MATPNFLTLPMEIRRQILIEALLSEILSRSPYPFGRHSLPYDRCILSVFSRNALYHPENDHQHVSPFWGKEPMTRIMRVNGQLYEEVYHILWSEFAIHRAPPDAIKHSVWMDWLRKNNPRAIPVIRHLQIHLTCLSALYRPLPGFPEYPKLGNEGKKRDIQDIQEEIACYPGLRSVTFQIHAYGIKDLIVEHVEIWMRIFNNANPDINVKIFLAPSMGLVKPEAEDFIRRCQDQIGQHQRSPALYHDMIRYFPVT